MTCDDKVGVDSLGKLAIIPAVGKIGKFGNNGQACGLHQASKVWKVLIGCELQLATARDTNLLAKQFTQGFSGTARREAFAPGNRRPASHNGYGERL
jgi:hypothetical protein